MACESRDRTAERRGGVATATVGDWAARTHVEEKPTADVTASDEPVVLDRLPSFRRWLLRLGLGLGLGVGVRARVRVETRVRGRVRGRVRVRIRVRVGVRVRVRVRVNGYVLGSWLSARFKGVG